MRRAELRLVPSACVLWTLAVVATVAGVRAVVIALVGLLAAAALGCALSGRREVVRAVAAHGVLVLLGACLLVPHAQHHEGDVDALTIAAGDGLRVTVPVRATADAASPRDGPAWARQEVRLTAVTVAGAARFGRDERPLRSDVRVLLRGDGDDGSGAGSRPALDAVRDGDHLRVSGTVHVDGTLVVLDVSRVEALTPQAGPRTALRDASRRATEHLPSDEAALVRGMTTGDTAGLSTEAEEAMRRAGISHLVAVSGANIALVLGAVLGPLLLLGVPRRPRILLAAGVGAAYVALVGDEPSVLRAATMAVPLLVARFLGIRAAPVAALAFTVALWSSLSPQTSASFGFVLSALATGAILVLARPAAAALTDLTGGRIGKVPALVLAVPLVAQLACTPVLILLEPEISVWAVGVNVVVMPIVAPVTVLGLLALLVAIPFPGIAAALDTLAAGGTHLVLVVARTADALPGSRLAVPTGAIGALLAVAVVVLAIVATALRHRRSVRFCVAVLAVAVLAPPVADRVLPAGAGDDWTVAICAVGQGDAVVLRGDATGSGPRPVVLVDTGPEAEPLTACLDALGVRKIDLLVLTHPHADHIGGVGALTGDRSPDAQWICPSEEAGRARSAPGGPTPRPVVRGEVGEAAGMRLEVLWPPSAAEVDRVSALETSSSEQGGANDCSVVLAASWPDGTRFVGLGDLEPAAQSQLARLDPGRADIVKVAHHGSRRQDPALYAGLAPRIAVIGVGRDNTFGHPAAGALSMLEGVDALVVRTDVDGSVAITPREAGASGEDEARIVGSPR